MFFSYKLRKWILSNYNSLNEFAKDLETSPQHLSRLLNGKRKPGYRILKKLYNLGCSIDWLLDDNIEDLDSNDGGRNNLKKVIKTLCILLFANELLSIITIPNFLPA